MSLNVKKKVETFSRKIDIAIPPENPMIRGHIDVDYFIRSKPEVKELSELGLSDEEYLPRIAKDIRGLGGDKPEDALAGEAAFTEVLAGPYSMYLVPAIVGAYFDQYGEARRGNSRARR